MSISMQQVLCYNVPIMIYCILRERLLVLVGWKVIGEAFSEEGSLPRLRPPDYYVYYSVGLLCSSTNKHVLLSRLHVG